MSLPDHNELKELFESDPLAFEAKRKILIQQHIDGASADSKDLLVEIQQKVDIRLAS